jgi:uncharacterized protein YecT (DUF1311 family)
LPWILLTAPSLVGQSSPVHGTFKIETQQLKAPEDSDTPDEQAYVVSLDDPKLREPLGDQHPGTTHVYYCISPDEQWIYAGIHYAHKVTDGELFKHENGLKFQPIKASLDESVWRFFATKEHLKRDDVPYFSDAQIGIIDFVAWRPDSSRLLLSLRAGDFGGERDRDVDRWYAYFNTKTETLELTDYLRRLNKGAWERRFGNGAIFGEAVCAEPLGESPAESELKKRYEEVDQRLNDLYNKALAKANKDGQQEMQRNQSDWIKTRDVGAKIYSSSGPKASSGRRYWQYMLASTAAQAESIASWGKTTE